MLSRARALLFVVALVGAPLSPGCTPSQLATAGAIIKPSCAGVALLHHTCSLLAPAVTSGAESP